MSNLPLRLQVARLAYKGLECEIEGNDVLVYNNDTFVRSPHYELGDNDHLNRAIARMSDKQQKYFWTEFTVDPVDHYEEGYFEAKCKLYIETMGKDFSDEVENTP